MMQSLSSILMILSKAGGIGPSTPTLVGPKILPFAVKVLYLQNFGRTNNCVVEVFLKWSDQSRTPSAAPVKTAKVLPIFKKWREARFKHFHSIWVFSSVDRVSEKLLYNQLIRYFKNNDLNSKNQWGFRKLHLTALTLLDTTNTWLLNIDKSDTNAVT